MLAAGEAVQLGAGYTVHQLKLGQAAAGGGGASWQSVASSSAVTYWNHDVAPCSTDSARRCLDWLNLAAAVGDCTQPPGPATALAAAWRAGGWQGAGGAGR